MPNFLEVQFDTGRVSNLSAECLRVYSPAADTKMTSVGGEKQQVHHDEKLHKTSKEAWTKQRDLPRRK